MAELNPNLLLILTGGEPLLRKDIYDLSSYASQKGMMVVLGTNGNMIDDDIAKKLKESGVTGIGISLDSDVPGRHDTFREFQAPGMTPLMELRHAGDRD